MQQTNYSKPKKFIVPQWLKGCFFWLVCLLFLGLVGFQVDRRLFYGKLLVFNEMRPESPGGIVRPEEGLKRGGDGSPISWQYFGNKWVLLHFWATWCPPCREEMASLEWFHRRMSDKLVVIAVSVDESWDDVTKFVSGLSPQMVMAWDPDRAFTSKLAVKRFPETFLISPEGKVVNRFEGPRDWSSKVAQTYLLNLFEDHGVPFQSH